MINKFLLLCFFIVFYACQNKQKEETDLVKTGFYTSVDTVIINEIKFSKKEFNKIIDNFPRLYQNEVLHPNSLYNSEFTNPHFAESYGQNISFDSDAGKDHYFVLYAHFLKFKNKGTRFENLRKHLKNSYDIINTFFERLNRGGTFYPHQSSCIPAYVEYDIYQLNHSNRLPEFTKKTRAERFEFIEDLKKQIENESKMVDMSCEFENEKISDLVNRLNEAIVNDYVLFKTKIFVKPYLEEFKENDD